MIANYSGAALFFQKTGQLRALVMKIYSKMQCHLPQLRMNYMNITSQTTKTGKKGY